MNVGCRQQVAVSGMESGWRLMVAGQKEVPAFSPGSDLLERTITHLVVTFWARLSEFAALGLAVRSCGWWQVC